MFGLEYLLAFIKVCFNIAFALVTAIPAFICWNSIAPIYFVEWLPKVFLHMNYWHVVSLFLVCTFVGEQIRKLVPQLVSVSQSNTNKE